MSKWLRKFFWVALAIGIYAVVILFYRGSRYSLSPEQVRPAGKAHHDQVIQSFTGISLKTLSEDPAPQLVVQSHSASLDVSYAVHQDRPVPDIPIYAANDDGTVIMPEGDSFSLEAVALVLPRVIEDGSDSKIPLELDWVHPISGKKVDDITWTPHPESTAGIGPTPQLYLKFKPDAKGRVIARRIAGYNLSNFARISSWTTYPGGPDHNEGEIYSFRINALNRHGIGIALEVAHGERIVRPLPVKVGEPALFHNHAQIDLIAEKKGRVTGGTQSYDSIDTTHDRQKRSIHFDDSAVHSKIFRVWPAEIASRLQFRWSPEGPFESSVFDEVESLSGDNPAAFDTAEISLFPNMARLIFEVPELTGLPVVENQFETPIPEIHFARSEDLLRVISLVTELRVSGELGKQTVAGTFPMTLRDTTPMELIELFEELADTNVYFNAERCELTDVKPPGLVDSVIEWWVKNKARWLP